MVEINEIFLLIGLTCIAFFVGAGLCAIWCTLQDYKDDQDFYIDWPERKTKTVQGILGKKSERPPFVIYDD